MLRILHIFLAILLTTKLALTAGDVPITSKALTNQTDLKTNGRIYRLTGQLVRAISGDAPQYNLHLQDAAGERIAYVDVSQMYIEDIRPYLDRTVFIHGEVKSLEENTELLVVLARTIRVGKNPR